MGTLFFTKEAIIYKWCWKNWKATCKKMKLEHFLTPSVQFSSVAQLCLILCNLMDCSTPGLPVHHQLPELTQTRVHRVMMPCNHLILCCPFLFPPSIVPTIRVFSNESVLHIRWPKYWSFKLQHQSFQ